MNDKPFLKITLIYFFISFAWIVLTDRLIFSITDNISLAEKLEVIKGIAFIIITSLLIFFLTRKSFYNEKKKNLQIKNREVIFSSLFQFLPIPTYLWKIDGNNFILKDFNKAAEEITHGVVRQYLGKKAQDIYLKNIQIVDDLEDCRENKNVLTKELEYSYQSTGETKQLKVTYVFIPNNLIMMHTEDVTDLKIYEDELRAAKDKAEDSNKLKSEFLAQMSHEIRTPVNTILSFSSLIREEIEDNLNDDLKTSFFLMENAGKRIVRTVELILNLSELQLGTYELNKKQIDLSPILFEITLEYRQQAKDKGLKIFFENNKNNINVLADEFTIYQIFENLINNAVKYTESGSINVKLWAEKNSIIAEVEDTGIGISEDFFPELFSPFTQEDQGYTRLYEGNGLGLSLVKKYCELNNAEIKVESEKGKGSKFIVIFPFYTS